MTIASSVSEKIKYENFQPCVGVWVGGGVVWVGRVVDPWNDQLDDLFILQTWI